MRKLVLAVLSGAAAAAPAQAGKPYYWHKAGVSRETFRSEAMECEELALAARPPRVQAPYSPNPIAAQRIAQDVLDPDRDARRSKRGC